MSSASSDTDECEDVSSDDDPIFGESIIHPSFERDIQMFQQYFPTETITHRLYDGLGELAIEMTVDIESIARTLLDAWGLSHKQAMTIRLKLLSSMYCFNESFSELNVYQCSTKKESAVLIQLKKIAQCFSRWYFSQQIQQLEETGKSGVAVDSGCRKKDKGYLVELCTKMQQRLKTLNDYCPICDRPHGSNSMIKPTVCSDPLCIFSSQTMGVMCVLIDAIQAEPKVVNLLIAFTLAASFSPRHKLILQPFPDLIEPVTNEFVFSHEKIKMLRTVMQIIRDFDFSGTPSELELKEKLNLAHKHAYSLLRWTISSNRSHIMSIPKEKQIPYMHTESQFVMRNCPPAEDEQFRALAQEYGSCFAFHGSPQDNWHSIVRQGLFVCSGTDLQLHGAMKGPGIYVSPLLDVALGYARKSSSSINLLYQAPSGRHQPQTTHGHGSAVQVENSSAVFCVALCEVITGPGLKKMDKKRWVVDDSRCICTRFFFMYGNNRPVQSTFLKSNNLDFQERIKTLLSDI